MALSLFGLDLASEKGRGYSVSPPQEMQLLPYLLSLFFRLASTSYQPVSLVLRFPVVLVTFLTTKTKYPKLKDRFIWFTVFRDFSP